MELTKVEIITRPSKLEELKKSLNKIGVLGMTVSQVYGCGLQKGHREIYRGQAYEINLVPKIKVETVVCEIPVERVLEVAEKLCDKVAIIKQGRLVKEGTMEEVKGDESLEEVFLELEAE